MQGLWQVLGNKTAWEIQLHREQEAEESVLMRYRWSDKSGANPWATYHQKPHLSSRKDLNRGDYTGFV